MTYELTTSDNTKCFSGTAENLKPTIISYDLLGGTYILTFKEGIMNGIGDHTAFTLSVAWTDYKENSVESLSKRDNTTNEAFQIDANANTHGVFAISDNIDAYKFTVSHSGQYKLILIRVMKQFHIT